MRPRYLLLLAFAFAVLGLRPGTAGSAPTQPAPQEPGVYLLDPASGRTVRLGGPDALAAWSPDGSRIAVANYAPAAGTCCAGLRIVRPATGDETVVVPPDLGSVGGVQWFPDGARLAFNLFPTTDGNDARRGLYVVPAGGTDMARLTADTPSGLAWTPDGRGLTVVQVAQGGEPAGQFYWRMVTLDAATGATSAVLIPDTSGMCPFALSWSPDGAYLAFFNGGVQNDPCFRPTPDTALRGLWVWEAATGMLRWLAAGNGGWGQPLWLPDGSILAQMLGGPAAMNPLINVGPDGTQVRFFADPNPQASFLVSNFPQTAAGMVLYVPYNPFDCDGGAVYIIGPGSSQPRQLTDPSTTVVSASLAPDGTRAAWVSIGPQGSSLVVGAVDGSSSRTVLQGAAGMVLLGWHPESAMTSAWSPDGRALLFAVTGDLSTVACR